MKSLMILALAAAYSAPILATTTKVEVKPENTTVEFHATGSPGALRMNGTGGHVSGSLDDDGATVSGVLTVKPDEFKTGIDLRDEHMQAALDTKNFPAATLKLDHAAKNGSFSGQLTLKGVTKTVYGTAKTDGKTTTAELKVDLAEYRPAIAKPKHLGVGIDDQVLVNVTIKQ